MSLPLADPQFWLVTAAALGAAIYLVRKRVRVRRKNEIAMPCENCAEAGAHAGSGGVARAVRRWILGEGKSGVAGARRTR